MIVNFKFSSKLDRDEDHLSIALNTISAIEDGINRGRGIAPEQLDSFTESVCVTNGIWDVEFRVDKGIFVRIPETPLWVDYNTSRIYCEVGSELTGPVIPPLEGSTEEYYKLITSVERNQ